MADLLECLIQIKGLADTPRRFAQRAAWAKSRLPSADEADRLGRDVARRLLHAEAVFRESLGLMLSGERPALPGVPPAAPLAETQDLPAECERRFAELRAETVRVLEGCSADQLNRIGIEPSRGPMTVADLVAVMLAHDTDRLGEMISR